MKEVVECLTAWIDEFRDIPGHERLHGLVRRSSLAIERLKKANISRTANAAKKAGRKRIPDRTKLKIARESWKTTIAKAAEKYGVATSTVVECRKLLDSMSKS